MWQDGKFHKLPENFQVPDMTVLSGWILWWEGIRDKNTPPLSSVGPFDIPKLEQHRFSDLWCIIRLLQNVLPKDCAFHELPTSMLITLGQEGIGKLAKKAQKNTIRVGDWKVLTALRQTRAAMNEENPGNKRIIRKPAATHQQQTNLLSKAQNK